nr:helix-turn-helix domain containing protein [Microbacterium halimionae]
MIALRLFEERGVADVTMDEIAAAAGVSRRTLFRLFPSKAALVWSGATEADARFEVAYNNLDAREGGVLTRIRVAYAASIAPLDETADITRLRLRLISDNPVVYAWGSDLRAMTRAHLAAHIAAALSQPVGSVRVLALVAAIEGATYAALAWWAHNGENMKPDDVIDEALAALSSTFFES